MNIHPPNPHPCPDGDVIQSSADNPASSHPMSRRVRSFVVRAGRMGSGQARALHALSERYVLAPSSQAWNAAAVFGRDSAPLIVDIGFGMGQATAEFAQAMRHCNVLGIEVHPPGVGSLLQLIDAQAIDNVRIIQHDAVEVLEQMILAESVDGMHIFFPDPWPKKRHHKRRLIQAAFIAMACERLKRGAYLHLATDWQPYAEHMLDVLQQAPQLRNRASSGFMPRPDSRPITKFERRGLALGHGVWDLVFERV